MNRVLILIFISALIFSCSDDRLVNESTVETGSINGIVFDFANDTIISGAFIYTEPPSASVKSDEQGEFQIDGIKVSDYKVIVEKHQYKTSESQFSVVANKTQEISIYLKGQDFKNSPPSIPVLTFPDFKSKVSSENFEFRWMKSQDEDDDRLHYTFFFGNEPNNLKILRDSLTDNSYRILSDLDTNQTYYWQVSVKDGFFTKYSEIYSFEYVSSKSSDDDNDTGGGSIDISTESLVLYLPLNNNSIDLSGNFNPGSIQNVDFVKNKNGSDYSAAYFKGGPSNSSKIVFPYDKKFDLIGDFTIACWIKQDLTGGENGSVGYYEIVSRWGGSGVGKASYAIGVNSNRQFFLSTYNGSNGDSYKSSELINPNQWYHLCATFDNGTVRFYVNGELTNVYSDAIYPQQSNFNLSIGARPDQLSSFHGVVDEVYLFNRALDPSEIEMLADY